MSEQQNAAVGADLVRERDFPSYAASLFVPPDARRAWLALSAFNAEVAHVRDFVSQPLPGEIRLQWWRDALTGEGQGADHESVGGNPIAVELLHAVKAYGLPVDLLVRLVDAHVFDVYDDPMPDMAALEAHCRDTAAALYRLRATVLGSMSSDVVLAAEHAGIAEGLVEVMRSLPKHAARRQLYLPGDLMKMNRLSPADVFAQKDGDPLQAVLAHLRGEAKTQLENALALLPDMPPAIRPAFLPLAGVKKMLARLETSSPFAPPEPSRLGMLWTTWRASRAVPFRV